MINAVDDSFLKHYWYFSVDQIEWLTFNDYEEYLTGN